jgi:hypothetical protein
MGKLSKYTPEILLGIYLVAFFVVKNPQDRFDRVLISDGLGYYGYLTAIFIYDDLDYNFIEDYEAKYYGHDKIKDFRQDVDGRKVNVYFPGLAFLFLPFFLIAHFLSLILGFPADGYSIIYQYSIGLAALFYLWLGLRFLQKLLLALKFSEKQTGLILVLIALGTNLNYYVLKEGAMSHVYSFAAISAFLFLIKRASENFKIRDISFAALLFGLIVIIRPTNGLVILLVPFIAGSSAKFFGLIQKSFGNLKNLSLIVLAGAFFPFTMMLLWFLQSGKWIVYSYGENGFNFTDPYFFQILFSFNKGWFIYTPVALIAMGGFIHLFIKNKFQFFWATSFLVIFIYVQSSWFCWTFTSNFGNRTFIDIYPFIAILLGYLFLLVWKKPVLKKVLISGFIILIGLNTLQFYQHYKYIFPPGEITFEIYKDSFSRLIPTAKVRIPEAIIISTKTFENDFENEIGWLNYESVTDTMAFEGKYASQAGKANDYSIGLLVDAEPLIKSENVVVKVSGQIYTNQQSPTAQLVVQLENQGKHYFYKPFYFHEYTRQNKWTYVEFACALPGLQNTDDQLRVFFFNSNKDEFFLIDNLKIEVLTLSEVPEHLK